MRLIVINATRDPALERLRRRNPGRVLARPTIAGLPLPQGGRRVLTLEHLKPHVVDQLEDLAAIGNVRVVEVGTRGDVDFAVVRQRLGYPARVVSIADTARVHDGRRDEILALQQEASSAPALDTLDEAPAPAAVPGVVLPAAAEVEPAPLTQELEALAVEHGLITKEAQDAVKAGDTTPQEIVEPVSATVEAVLGEPASVPAEPVSTTEAWVAPADLEVLVRGSRNAALSSALAIFGKSGAGNKLRLVSEVLDCFSGDPDPVLALRALALLREAQA